MKTIALVFLIFSLPVAAAHDDDEAEQRRIREEAQRVQELVPAIKASGLVDITKVGLKGEKADHYTEVGTKLEYFKSARLTYTESEIDELAKLYAGCREEKDIRSVLRKNWDEGKKSIALEEILPPWVKKTSGTKADKDGPNCHNSTLNFFGCTKLVRCSEDEEILGTLKKSFRPLGKGDRLVPGDVISIYAGRDPANQPIEHTAVYVGGDLFFHKPSRDQRHPYGFVSFASLTGFYAGTWSHRQIRIEFHRRVR